MRSTRITSLVGIIFALRSAHGHAMSFAGTGLGAIPDGSDSGTCDITTRGTARVVSFAVSGLTAAVGTVGVRMIFNPAHTFVADLHITLSAPAGSPQMTIFGDTTGAGLNHPGGDSQVAGPYLFADSQTGDWWSAALAANGHVIPAGGYRTSADGAATQTSLNAIFGGLAPAQANGIWTLSFTDDCSYDTGSVSEATLFINDIAMPVHLQDFTVD